MSVFSKILIHQNWQYLLQLTFGILPCLFLPMLYSILCSHLAYHFGDPTPKLNGRGQLSLRLQLDPVGYLLFLTTGIGWGKPLPIRRENFTSPNCTLLGVHLLAVGGCLLFGWGMLFLSTFWDLSEHTSLFSTGMLLFFLNAGVLSCSFSLFQVLPLPFFAMYQVIFPYFPAKAQSLLEKYQGHFTLALAIVLWTGYLQPFLLGYLSIFLKPLTYLSGVSYSLLVQSVL